jgi:hypothetical protein
MEGFIALDIFPTRAMPPREAEGRMAHVGTFSGDGGGVTALRRQAATRAEPVIFLLAAPPRTTPRDIWHSGEA